MQAQDRGGGAGGRCSRPGGFRGYASSWGGAGIATSVGGAENVATSLVHLNAQSWTAQFALSAQGQSLPDVPWQSAIAAWASAWLEASVPATGASAKPRAIRTASKSRCSTMPGDRSWGLFWRADRGVNTRCRKDFGCVMACPDQPSGTRSVAGGFVSQKRSLSGGGCPHTSKFETSACLVTTPAAIFSRRAGRQAQRRRGAGRRWRDGARCSDKPGQAARREAYSMVNTLASSEIS